MNDTVLFGLSQVALLAGLATLLYGVSLNAGQAVNTPMIAGGVIILVATGALVAPGLAGDGHGTHE